MTCSNISKPASMKNDPRRETFGPRAFGPNALNDWSLRASDSHRKCSNGGSSKLPRQNNRYSEMTTFLVALTFLAGFLVVFAMNLFLADVQQSNRQSVRLRLEDEWRARNAENARLDFLDQSRNRKS